MGTQIYFATNRCAVNDPPTDFNHNFSSKGLQDLRFGKAIIDVNAKPENCIIDLAVAPEVIDSNNPSLSILGSKAIYKDIKDKMLSGGKDTVVMIHGYATSFKQALKGAAIFKEVYKKFDFNVVMFTWPSDGRNLPQDYGNDRHDAKASGMAVARAMMKLVDFLRPKNLGQPCGQKLHLLAHSMGNYVLRNALWELKKMYPGQHLPTIFENIFLMAADEDNDAFEMEQKFRDLPSLARQVNVYFNKYDKALWCSDLTKGNPDRLGNTGPRKPLDVPAKVVLIDVSALDPFTDFIGHGYYDSWKGVIDDVTAVFEGLEPDKIPGRHYVPSANKYRLG